MKSPSASSCAQDENDHYWAIFMSFSTTTTTTTTTISLSLPHLEVPADQDVLDGLKAGDLDADVPPLHHDPTVVIRTLPESLVGKQLHHHLQQAGHELCRHVDSRVQHQAGAEADVVGKQTKLLLRLREVQDLQRLGVWQEVWSWVWQEVWSGVMWAWLLG